MEFLLVDRSRTCIIFSFCDHVEGSGGRIDYRRSGDADFRDNICLAGDIGGGDGRYSRGWINETHLPQHLAGTFIRIEGIDTVVFGSHVHHIVCSLGRDRHITNVERLRKNRAIYRATKQLPEWVGFAAYARRRKRDLLRVLSRQTVVVSPGVNASESARGSDRHAYRCGYRRARLEDGRYGY